jgi:hypothetical protein
MECTLIPAMAAVPTAKATIFQKRTHSHCMKPAFDTLSQHSTKKTLLLLLLLLPAFLAQSSDSLQRSDGDSNTLFRSDLLCHQPNTRRINQFEL